MKTFYLIGGPMGVGKTAVCQILKKRLDRCVFLDGDWCWDMDPFVVNAETKALVLDNICGLLNRFLSCTVFQHVVCCWVLHQQETWDSILDRIDTRGWKVICVSLTASTEALTSRLEKDIAQGRRQPDVIQRSLDRLPLYRDLHTLHIDTTGQTPEETAAEIAALESPTRNV